MAPVWGAWSWPCSPSHTSKARRGTALRRSLPTRRGLPDADVDVACAMRVGALLDSRIGHGGSAREIGEPVEKLRVQFGADAFVPMRRAEVDPLRGVADEVEQLRAKTFPVHVF